MVQVVWEVEVLLDWLEPDGFLGVAEAVIS